MGSLVESFILEPFSIPKCRLSLYTSGLLNDLYPFSIG
jgi:hypothetical protein